MYEIVSELKKVANREKATVLRRYFKTGRGEYGEGDEFIGITVPVIRLIAKRYYENITLKEIKKMLESKIHEHRFIALEMLVMKYESAKNQTDKKVFFKFYLGNLSGINNWDLVDTSAPYIVGDYLFYRPRNLLYRLVKSKNLWARRIAVVSNYVFIKSGDFSDICEITESLLNDPQPLIHKVCGWMLREMGKKDENALIKFLNKNYLSMPRIMLNYATERLSKKTKMTYNRTHVKTKPE